MVLVWVRVRVNVRGSGEKVIEQQYERSHIVWVRVRARVFVRVGVRARGSSEGVIAHLKGVTVW